MLTFIVALLLHQTAEPRFKVAAVLGAPLEAVVRTVGPGGKVKRGRGYEFACKGFFQVWCDDIGSKMKDLSLKFDKLYSPAEALGKLGLPSRHLATSPVPLSNVPIMLTRNKCTLSNIDGLPHGGWKIRYEETAIANKDRTRALKSQIDAAAGDARLQLIKKCYDWYSNLEFYK